VPGSVFLYRCQVQLSKDVPTATKKWRRRFLEFTLYRFEVHFNIIPRSLPLPTDLFPSVFSTKICTHFVISPMRIACLARLLILDLIVVHFLQVPVTLPLRFNVISALFAEASGLRYFFSGTLLSLGLSTETARVPM
jgi:hypothetical protein